MVCAGVVTLIRASENPTIATGSKCLIVQAAYFRFITSSLRSVVQLRNIAQGMQQIVHSPSVPLVKFGLLLDLAKFLFAGIQKRAQGSRSDHEAVFVVQCFLEGPRNLLSLRAGRSIVEFR